MYPCIIVTIVNIRMMRGQTKIFQNLSQFIFSDFRRLKFDFNLLQQILYTEYFAFSLALIKVQYASPFVAGISILSDCCMHIFFMLMPLL
ncbi:CLUMA_CG008779, isoform A [Clunio marinus]|uniref:CLUMA_CG008779, isoform A n=1 Tax=Clunio marinus TaxID=568069 RepID=A0A1J1I577_9DIPT|nr:CLUMA_CG008779, isoform A [Clunio marinus]